MLNSTTLSKYINKKIVMLTDRNYELSKKSNLENGLDLEEAKEFYGNEIILKELKTIKEICTKRGRF